MNEKRQINPVRLLLLGLIVMLGINLFSNLSKANDVTYYELRQLFQQEKVQEFQIANTRLTAKLADGSSVGCDLYDFDLFYEDMNDLVQQQAAAGIIKNYNYWADHSTNWLEVLLPCVLVLVGMFFLMGFMNRAGGVQNDRMAKFGEARVQDGSKTGKTFKDVAGADEEKEELREIVEFLRDPEKFVALGAHIPKGVLLVGPPGTGKTLLAKAVAGEAGVRFFSISGSDFVEMYVGVGASRVRDLFAQAKKDAPAIVFIDEIDAVGRKRGSGLGGGHDEREQTLNQLLVEMDGFGTNEGVVVLAATNRVDILEPDIKGRREILAIHARKKPLAEDVDLDEVARSTSGFTGADLENLLNEAALLAGRKNRPVITMEDVQESVIKVLAGPEKRSRVVPERERKLTAYHEAGHAVAALALPEHEPVHQVTIVPRGQAGGLTSYLPEEDTAYYSKKYMEERLITLRGGRVAEALMLGDISTGASNDLQRATAMARKMVGTYGMSEKIGAVAFDAGSDEVFIGKSMAQTRPYSEKTAAEMDEEVRRIIDEAYNRCREILEQNRTALIGTAEYLLEHETMSGEELKKIFDAADSAEE